MSHHPDDEELDAELKARIEELAERFLDAPNRSLSSRRELRFGTHGSLSVVISGPKKGAWIDRESGQGGYPIQLVMRGLNCDFAAAKEWARDYTGIRPSAAHDSPDHLQLMAERAAQRAAAEAAQAAETEKDEQRRIGIARALWDASRPIGGTVAETYLIETRCIPRPRAGWPSCVRFHGISNSLIVASTLDDGETITAVQRIHLTPEGKKDTTRGGTGSDMPAKITNGVLRGAYVRLPRMLADTTLIIAEGPETGLSAWVSTGCETWLRLGNIATATPPQGRQVVMAADDDPQDSPAAAALAKKLSEWRASGAKVALATAWPERRYDKSDLNDTIKVGGLIAVRERIKAAIEAIPEDPKPEHAMPTLTVEEAGERIKPKVNDFFREAAEANARIAGFKDGLAGPKKALRALNKLEKTSRLDDAQRRQRDDLQALVNVAPPPAPHHGLKVGLGIGKTSAGIKGLAPYIARSVTAGASRALWTTPTLELADQTAFNIASKGVSVGVYRGRRAINPDAASKPAGPNDDSGRMCLDLPAVRLAIEAAASVSDTVCGKEKDEDHKRCPYFERCPYQRNNKVLRDQDVIVAAHDALMRELPPEIEKGLDLTIIDEGFWQVGLGSSDLGLDHLVDDLERAPVLEEGEANRFATERLRSTMEALKIAISQHADATPIQREALRAAGLDAARCREAAREQWRRMIDLKMHPGMPADERRAAALGARTNRRIPKMAMLLRIAADILDGAEGVAGRLETATVEGKDRTERRIVIHFLRGLLNARMERPILHLDATMPIAAVRQYLPELDVVAEIDAAAPHMRVVQVLSTKDNYGGWGKTSIIPDRAKAQGEGKRRESRLVNLGDFLTLMQRQLGEGSVFTYKDIEERFAKPGIRTSHFNAVAGLNSHENATFAAVLGRPSPKPEDAARMVKQLFGRWAEAENMVEVQAALLMADGSARTITTRRFASPDLELIRRSIADDNVVQAVGRVRGVRRTGANPVAVFLFTDVVTPFPVSALTDWPTLELDRVDQMAARGVILKSPADAAKAYPDLFKDARAAYDALRAGRSNVKTPKKSIFIGEFTFDRPFATVRYRPLPTQAEPKPKTRTADVTDMARVPGIRAWLEALVGTLAIFEFVLADQAAQGPPGDEGDIPEVTEAPAPEDIAAATKRAADEAAGAEFDRLFASATTAPPLTTGAWEDPVDANLIAAGMYARARGEPVRRPAIRLPQLHVGRMDRGEIARLQEQVWARVERGEGSALAAQLVAFVGERLMRAAA